ncbi:hypothetical protein [Novacetimonas hansenii]|uniref:Uncharacterized protein n=2 Tax=Novacetimonas hansenii TaxID=436 RepID=A0AAW5ER84_NOVHA|nr:hypothetical protein [Novacetimonas hansenii]MCJ8353227.1 hypothetical protein [Novacetimonas hansenii]
MPLLMTGLASSLPAKALRDKLVPQTPNDEPASAALLDNIRAKLPSPKEGAHISFKIGPLPSNGGQTSMAEEPSLMDEKWVRIMGEYGCEGVWHRDGCATCADELPISEGLRAQLLSWAKRYDDYDFPPEKDSPPFDMAAFAQDGLEIARAIKAELPEWTVIYFDESKADYKNRLQPREQYEYEV